MVFSGRGYSEKDSTWDGWWFNDAELNEGACKHRAIQSFWASVYKRPFKGWLT